MRVLGFIALGAIAAMGVLAGAAGASPEAGCAPLPVQVDVSETSGAADLEGFRGMCVWNLPSSDPDDGMHKAWMRAGLTLPRWPWLGGVGASWQERDDGSREMVLHFDYLDAVIAEAKKMGIEPIFSVGGPPRALSSNPDVENKPNDNYSSYTPADYGEWEEYLSRIVRRLVEAGYGGRYYEVLNEPEDFGSYWKGKPGSTKYDTLADYLELYVRTERAIKAADPCAKVGGPVTAHWDSVTASGGGHGWGLPEFLRALAEYRRENPDAGVSLDFVDWHDYSFTSHRLSDGADFVDKVLTEAGWPGRPEYLVTEWNRTLSNEGVSGHERAAHAAWNVVREADPATRRIARTYWYVLDGGGNIAVVDEHSREGEESGSSTHYFLSPTYAVFEMLGRMNRGSYLRVNAAEPLVALATGDGEAVSLLVCNNTTESHTASIELSDLPAQLRNGRCRVQLVDAEHSEDGNGLEAGREVFWQPGQALALELTPYATALVTIASQ